jgi:signal transduction histidine kinase
MASPSNPSPVSLNEALRENQELRSSLAQLQREKAAAADSASAQLRQFLYAASHDLQEPLRAILSYSQLLDRELAGDAPAREYFSFILSGANRMKELLQRLLVYSRAGSSKQRNIVSLNVPLEMALLKLAADIKSSSARIHREPLPEAIADEGEIAQVFENLLGNSLKFRSADAPEITITAEQGSGECTISLRDNGMGLDPRFCEQALLPFKRLHSGGNSGSGGNAGSGLGLAICERIIRAHDGRIWLESDGSHGTMVRFTLPA